MSNLAWFLLSGINTVIGIYFHSQGSLTGPLVFLLLGDLVVSYLFAISTSKPIEKGGSESDLAPENELISPFGEDAWVTKNDIRGVEERLDAMSAALETHTKALDFLVGYVQAAQSQHAV